jgi:hypothetical protein
LLAMPINKPDSAPLSAEVATFQWIPVFSSLVIFKP